MIKKTENNRYEIQPHEPICPRQKYPGQTPDCYLWMHAEIYCCHFSPHMKEPGEQGGRSILNVPDDEIMMRDKTTNTRQQLCGFGGNDAANKNGHLE
jgi:hypothetical protein